MSLRWLDSQSSAISNSHKSTRDKNSSFENGPDLPDNFAKVTDGIYRCSFPQEHHLQAIKELRLKTVVTLVEEPYSSMHQTFLKEGGITHHRILVHANKDPAVRTPNAIITKILEILVTKSNQPVLVHCNKGKHRTGSVIACLRKLQGWSLESAIAEYVHFSHPKSRELDIKFIEEFDVSNLAHLSQTFEEPPWDIPAGPVIPVEDDDGYPSPTWYLQSSINRVNVV